MYTYHLDLETWLETNPEFYESNRTTLKNQKVH